MFVLLLYTEEKKGKAVLLSLNQIFFIYEKKGTELLVYHNSQPVLSVALLDPHGISPISGLYLVVLAASSAQALAASSAQQLPRG